MQMVSDLQEEVLLEHLGDHHLHRHPCLNLDRDPGLVDRLLRVTKTEDGEGTWRIEDGAARGLEALEDFIDHHLDTTILQIEAGLQSHLLIPPRWNEG